MLEKVKEQVSILRGFRPDVVFSLRYLLDKIIIRDAHKSIHIKLGTRNMIWTEHYSQNEMSIAILFAVLAVVTQIVVEVGLYLVFDTDPKVGTMDQYVDTLAVARHDFPLNSIGRPNIFRVGNAFQPVLTTPGAVRLQD